MHVKMNVQFAGREFYGGRPRAFSVGLGKPMTRFWLNGARGTRDIEGKVTRVGASEHGLRTSFKTERERNPQLLSTPAQFHSVLETVHADHCASEWNCVTRAAAKVALCAAAGFIDSLDL